MQQDQFKNRSYGKMQLIISKFYIYNYKSFHPRGEQKEDLIETGRIRKWQSILKILVDQFKVYLRQPVP